MSERLPYLGPELTEAQTTSLQALCERYNAPFDQNHYAPAFDLPEGWVCGWLGGPEFQQVKRTLYVGVSPEGEVHS